MTIQGCYAPIVIPIKGESLWPSKLPELKKKTLDDNLKYLFENNIDGVVVGPIEEHSALTSRNSADYIRFIGDVFEIVEKLNNELGENYKGKRLTNTSPTLEMQVISGGGSNYTKAAIDLIKKIEDKTDVFKHMQIIPLPLTQREIWMHFEKISRKIKGELILYSDINNKILPETVAELAKIDNIIAINESSDDLENKIKIIEKTKKEKFNLLNGYGPLNYEVIKHKGSGFVSLEVNLAPKLFYEMWLYNKINNRDKSKNGSCLGFAEAIHKHLNPLYRLFYSDSNLDTSGQKFIKFLGFKDAKTKKILKSLGYDYNPLDESAISIVRYGLELLGYNVGDPIPPYQRVKSTSQEEIRKVLFDELKLETFDPFEETADGDKIVSINQDKIAITPPPKKDYILETLSFLDKKYHNLINYLKNIKSRQS